MFNFFSKNKKEKPAAVSETQVVLSEEETAQINERLDTLRAEAKELEETKPQETTRLAELQEKIGLAYTELSETDPAIEALEKSLDLKLSIGDGYKKLMSLYNAKRAEAARNGDDAGIDKYMGKMDEMRQIAKKVTVGGK